MEQFISEPVTPVGRQMDAGAMARGEPGLPVAFHWRESDYRVVERLAQWKATSPEGGRAGGEVYLRRHYFRLRMSDGALWTVYFTRQAARGGSAKRRWFLFSIEFASAK